MYYSEVKNLITIIKAKQKEFTESKLEESKGEGSEMEIDAGNPLKTEEDKKRLKEEIYYQNIGGKFVPVHSKQPNSRSKSAAPFSMKGL